MKLWHPCGLVAGLSLLWGFTPSAQAPRASVDAKWVERARVFLDSNLLIDGHNDLPSVILERAAGDLGKVDLSAIQPDYPADIPRLREGRVGAQFWAAFVDVEFMTRGTALAQGLREIDMVHRLVARHPELELARTADDIERLYRQKKIASLIGVEGGHAIENSLSALRMFHELGVRYMTLTHWATTDWADAATDHARHHGLTEFGEEVVREMNRLGMFVDLSHVSPETMKDALRVSRAPVIYSHSNALAFNSHPRNVPDELLRQTARNGGVVMVNFIADYVPMAATQWYARRDETAERIRAEMDDEEAVARALQDWVKKNPMPRGTVVDVANHLDHIRKVAGIDHVGIGSDFYDDGRLSMAEGLENPSAFPLLFAELMARGYSDQDLRKIASQNLLRAMRAMEQVARDLQKARPPSVSDMRRPPRL